MFFTSGLGLFAQDQAGAKGIAGADMWATLDGYLMLDGFDFGLFEIVASISILFLTLALRKVLMERVFRWMEPKNGNKDHRLYPEIVEVIRKPLSFIIFLVGLFFAVSVFPLGAELRNFVTLVFRGGSMLIVVWAFSGIIDALLDSAARNFEKRKSPIYGFFPLLKKSTKIVVVILGVLMVIRTLGYEVGPLLATLGLGGIALAYASQDTVANFFGSLCIVLDRPFQVGDWIEVNSKVNGTVTGIGLRSTRIRTFMATSLSIPNRVLANETINNWSKMPKRRVKQTIGVSYDTRPEDIENIVNDIRFLLKNDTDINQEFILVNFTGFGESALEILVYYFTKTTVWLDFLDVQQRMNIKIIEIIRRNNSSIAFPTRTLHLSDDFKKVPQFPEV